LSLLAFHRREVCVDLARADHRSQKSALPGAKIAGKNVADKADRKKDIEATYSDRLRITTWETLATDRPEPAMKLSNWGPELKEPAMKNWPRYCHRLEALFTNTGIGVC